MQHQGADTGPDVEYHAAGVHSGPATHQHDELRVFPYRHRASRLVRRHTDRQRGLGVSAERPHRLPVRGQRGRCDEPRPGDVRPADARLHADGDEPPPREGLAYVDGPGRDGEGAERPPDADRREGLACRGVDAVEEAVRGEGPEGPAVGAGLHGGEVPPGRPDRGARGHRARGDGDDAVAGGVDRLAVRGGGEGEWLAGDVDGCPGCVGVRVDRRDGASGVAGDVDRGDGAGAGRGLGWCDRPQSAAAMSAGMTRQSFPLFLALLSSRESTSLTRTKLLRRVSDRFRLLLSGSQPRCGPPAPPPGACLLGRFRRQAGPGSWAREA